MGISVFAQSSGEEPVSRNCGAMDNLEYRKNANPKLNERMEAIEKHYAARVLQGIKSVDGDIITIPVVVHIIYSNNNENISDAQIQSQIDVLNEDFRRTNPDQDNVWSQADDSQIEFCLASVDPNGNTTDGITRTASNRTSWGTNDAIKSASNGGVNAWDTSQYLNMWIGNIGGGILGYAQFPGGNASTDGLVMSPQYFGSSAKGSGFYLSAPFDLGRTTTHEVGHFLNLRHIWGDGGCGVDDLVSDTPLAGDSNGGCSVGSTSCGSVDMVQNYMDYTDDDCMNLFTEGQVERMRAVLEAGGSRRSLALSTKCQGGTTNPPSVGCTSTISNFPYAESFETGLGAWSNEEDTDDIDWTRDASGTPSSNTGPSSGSNGDYYMYVEASGNGSGYPNKNAILNSPCFDLSGVSSATFGFEYHMNGSAIGVLSVQARTDNEGAWSTLFSISGTQGTDWNAESINLSSYVGESSVQLRFNTTTGSSWQGDVAIDGVVLSSENDPGPPTGTCTDIEVNFTFDNYPEETSFAITNTSGNIVASGGTYGSQADGSSLTITECLDAGCYNFTITDAYGDGICCGYGNGAYSISANGIVLISGGQFGSSETTEFCVGEGVRSIPVIRTVNEADRYVPMVLAPNPTNSGIVNITGVSLDTAYHIYNVYGQKVLDGTMVSNSVDVSTLSVGVYMIKIANGKEIKTLPFVVEK
ncbi:hypothetical protein GCM10022393_04980 [Aquimarina addita]|uniref:MAM domain-containing protein n=2 Tax=Aquimarina addita TaxID=870485 RepID=A0ABP7X9U7_9FLAO